MNRLKDRCLFAQVAAGHDAQAAHQARGQIAHHVAIKIGQQHHVKLMRVEHQLHAGVVHDQFFVLDVRIIGRYPARAGEKQPVGELHDVGFVNGVNLFSAMPARVLKREPGDPRRSLFGDDLQTLYHSRHHGVLQARVEVFRVFADYHQVHAVEPRLHPFEVFHGAKVGIQLKGLTQSHVDARRAAGDRCSHRALQRRAVAPHRFDHCGVGQFRPGSLFCGARRDFFPLDRNPRSVDDPPRCLRHLGADAFAGYERDSMRHRNCPF